MNQLILKSFIFLCMVGAGFVVGLLVMNESPETSIQIREKIENEYLTNKIRFEEIKDLKTD